MNDADKIQIVINTISELKINATFDNMNRLLGMYQMLTEVRDHIRSMEVAKDGNTDVQ